MSDRRRTTRRLPEISVSSVPGATPDHVMTHDVPLDLWISVAQLAQSECTSKRQVYAQIDAGMPHSRIGTRIRVRRCDWRAWHEAHVAPDARRKTVHAVQDISALMNRGKE